MKGVEGLTLFFNSIVNKTLETRAVVIVNLFKSEAASIMDTTIYSILVLNFLFTLSLFQADNGSEIPSIQGVPPSLDMEIVLRSSYVGLLTATYYWNVTMKLEDLETDKAQVWKIGSTDQLMKGCPIVLYEPFSNTDEVGALTQVGNTTYVRRFEKIIGPTPLHQLWKAQLGNNQQYYLINVGSGLCLWWQ